MIPSQPRYRQGDKIGGNFLVHKVLTGGMGEVYLCTELQSRLPYALKTFQPKFLDSPKARAAFKREAGLWIALGKHPNIVSCFFLEVIDNQSFIVLEWVAGEDRHGTSLGSWLADGPLAPRLALDFAIDICRGLAYADLSQPGIVHCDLKPENVLVSSSLVAKITDFGLSRVFQSAQQNSGEVDQRGRLSGNRDLEGSARYMAPEQWLGEALDARADIYAFGCVLYEMLTGDRRQVATTLDEIRRWHFEPAKPGLPHRDPLSQDVNRALARCLATRREDRFATVDELLETLTTIYCGRFGSPPAPVPQGRQLEARDHLDRGSTYCLLSRFGDAVAELTHAIQLGVEPLYRAYHDRGFASYGLGHLDAAVADFTSAIQLNPTAAIPYTSRGSAYEHLGQYEAALVDHNQAIQLDPKLALAYSNRGAALHYLGRSDEAMADLGEGIRLDPGSWRGFERRGNILDLLGRLEGALADYSSAIQLEPARAQFYRARGSILQRSGREDEALADFGRALEWDTGCLLALVGIGAVAANRGQLPAALTYFETAARSGESLGAQYAARVRRELGMEPFSDDDTLLFAFEAVRRADSLHELLRAVGVFPFLTTPPAAAAFEKFMAQDSALDKRTVEQRVSWLRQIANAQAIRERTADRTRLAGRE